MATGLGVLPSAIDDEPVFNVFELLEYWSEEPPSHVVLALKYLGERKKPKPQSEKEAFEQLQGAASIMGNVAEPVPQHLREMAQWADEMQDRLKKKS